jgi:hypothetical protein
MGNDGTDFGSAKGNAESNGRIRVISQVLEVSHGDQTLQKSNVHGLFVARAGIYGQEIFA